MERNLLLLIGFVLICAVLVITLKDYNPQIALLVAIGASVVILIYLINLSAPVIQQILQFTESVTFQHFDILIKAVILGFLVEVASSLCRDAGQSAMAAKIEIAGKVVLVALALPLVGDLLALVVELINL